MAIEVKITGDLQKTLTTITRKYPNAANLAARKAGFFIQKQCVSKFLSVADGSATRTKTRKATKRTHWLTVPGVDAKAGLRTATATLKRSIQVGVYDGNNLQIITSENSGVLKEKLLSGVAVGTSLIYGRIHERGGLEGKPGKYAFLAPAFKDSSEGIKRIFDSELKNAEREV